MILNLDADLHYPCNPTNKNTLYSQGFPPKTLTSTSKHKHLFNSLDRHNEYLWQISH